MPRGIADRAAPVGQVGMLAVAGLLLAVGTAAAHGAERGFVLLLPTGYYIVGGVAAVAVSFVLLAATSPKLLARLWSARLRVCALPAISPVPTSLAAFLVMSLLLAAGLEGSRDPLANPLPLAVWAVWWIGITLIHALFGNLWAYINPWTGPYRLLDGAVGGRLGRAARAYPVRLGYWPAVILFFAFAWFELVDPAPDDPERLAFAVGVYWILGFAGMLMFGEAAWRARAEPFSVFYSLVGKLSPLVWEQDVDGGRRLSVALPGTGLASHPGLPLSGVLFVLLTLSTVSFDGLSKTFWWLALGGINPLEYPGRSAVLLRNSVGLLAAFATLAACYTAAVRIGAALAGEHADRNVSAALVLAILPISIAFHFSHYLTALLVNGQYAVIAVAESLGFGHGHVTTSFLSTYGGVRAIWNIQTAGIVLGHVAGVALAHVIAAKQCTTRRAATLQHLPLAVLMVAYTWFGLWLLSTPVVG